jgi:hypothetical protein
MAGDIKWMCMLLGMEDMTLHWCIYCQLSREEEEHCDHNRGEACTIDYINRPYKLNDKKKSKVPRSKSGTLLALHSHLALLLMTASHLDGHF